MGDEAKPGEPAKARRPEGSHGDDVDVAVVGAGLSGLYAARILAGHGKRVAVLEARKRVGGKTLTRAVGAGTFDFGGQFVGKTHARLRRLAGELGVRIFPTYDEGRHVADLRGTVIHYEGVLPQLPPLDHASLLAALAQLETLRATLGATGLDPMGHIDATSVEQWKVALLGATSPVEGMIEILVRALYSAEPRDISLLHFLSFVHRGGGFDELIGTEGGAQDGRFAGGAQQLSEKMREGLGDAVLLETPVRRIVHEADGVTLISDRHRVRAGFAVVAIPPRLAAMVEHDAPPPGMRERQALAAAMKGGHTIKAVLTYPTAFWRHGGFSGQAISDRGPVTFTFDDSSEDGSQAALLAFVAGQAAEEMDRKPEEERRRAVTAQLSGWFGPEAAVPSEYVDGSWCESRWSGDCPFGFTPPGVLHRHGVELREPVGRIHWAGAETGRACTGYMEGALESAERAAGEVLARLG